MSSTDRTTISCPQCQTDIVVVIWQVIDLATEPDLRRRFLQGEINVFDCPNCNAQGKLDVPMAVYDPAAGQVIFYIPDDPQITPQIIGQVQADLGNALMHNWFGPYPDYLFKPRLIRDLMELSQMLVAEETNELEDNNVTQARQQLYDTIWAFIEVETWTDSQYIVENYPDLLSDDADTVITQIIEVSQQEFDGSDHIFFAERLAILRRCREIGIDAAFAEKFGGDSTVDEYILPEIKRHFESLTPGQRQTFFEMAQEFSQLHQPGDITRRVELSHQMLQMMNQADNPQFWAALQDELGCSFAQNPLGSRAENLEQAIYHFEQALTAIIPETMPVDWVQTMMNLANAYSHRIRGDRAENIEQAIDIYQQALTVITKSTMQIDWANAMLNLAIAYRNRIRGDRAENIELTIEASQQALTVFTEADMPADWSGTMNNLANAYIDRIRGGRAENIELAIEASQRALTIRTKVAMPVEWSGTKNNLANAYAMRVRGDQAENIEQAIEAYQQVLTVRTKAAMPFEWADTMNNLAAAFIDRIRGERAENIELAIEAYQQNLTVFTETTMPVDWAITMSGLALAYAGRIQGERAENIEIAIAVYKQILTVFTLDQMPAEHRKTQRSIGNLFFNERRWADANDAYLAVIESGQLLLNAAYTEIGRRIEIAETTGFFVRLAYGQLHQGELETALLTLEHGKTRLLTEALALVGADLDMLPPNQQQTVQQGRESIRQLEAEMRLRPDIPGRRDERELAQALGQARTDLNQLIGVIRQGYPDFMPTGLTPSEFLALIPMGGALVAPLVTSQGSVVFVVPHGVTSVKAENIVWLDEVTDKTVKGWLIGTEEKLGWMGEYIINANINQDGWFMAIEQIITMLCEQLIKPILHKLDILGIGPGSSLLIMPQGGLGLLPLHAALLDNYAVTYAPSGYSLHAARQRLKTSDDAVTSLLAVANPTSDLFFTSIEVSAITDLFASEQVSRMDKDEATLAAVGQRLQPATCHLFHFSGHGFYNWQEVMQSGLVLADGTLTLSHLISQTDLSAVRLVTLSACETGITDITQSPDEFLGLPAGLMQAGVPAVVSTLWAVNDLSTMLLMERFYQHYLQNELPLPEALRRAQIWLRDVTAGELATRSLRGSTNYRRFSRDFKAGDRPFEHPYYWAAFTFNGT